jgi:predicted NUDIX family NTP pyrophosphohydrolase
MPKHSAGILLFPRRQSHLEVLLAHPGGPLWKNKDEGSWSIPKGEYGGDEDPLAAARREFQEETGIAISGDFIPLGEIRQRSGKIVTAWALERDLDPASVRGNTFSMVWPPRSGKLQEFPEIDRAEWFSLDTARRKIIPAQAELLDRLTGHLRRS